MKHSASAHRDALLTSHAPPPCVQLIGYYPGYNPKTFENDLAYLVLEKPARARPVALAPSNYILPTRPGQYLWIAGWGATESADASSHLK